MKIIFILSFCISVSAMDLFAMDYCGSLKVITGPMYSGKSEKLMRIIKRLRLQGKNVLVCKHSFDNRAEDSICSKGLTKTIPAIPIYHVLQILDIIADYDVVALDEVQFFDESLISVINRLNRQGIDVIACGLDTDFKREPFVGCMPKLLCLADKVKKLKAICSVCGCNKATLTQRLVNGAPASSHDELVIIDNGQRPVTYEPRCRNCHILNFRKSKSCECFTVIE